MVAAFDRFPEVRVSRGVRDVMTFIHEYTHLITQKMVWEPHEREISEARTEKYNRAGGVVDLNRSMPTDLDMAFRALDEGVAILVERLVAHEIRTNYQKYGMSESEAREIGLFIKARSDGLLDNQTRVTSGTAEEAAAGRRAMCYNEGSEIMRQIYNTSGLLGIKQTMERLDTVKVSVTERSDPRYKEVVEHPAKLLGLFGKN